MNPDLKEKDRIYFPSLIFFLAVLLYLPSINTFFLNDEIAFISRNKVEDISGFVSLLDKKDYDGDYYRPLGNLVSGSLTYFAQYTQAPYRIFNLLLNAFNGVLVFFLVTYLPIDRNFKKITALFSALFFIAFPLNIYAVIWHTDLFDRLLTFFYLLSVLLYLKESKPNMLSLLFFLLAMLSKEMAFSIPVVIFILSFYNTRNIKRSIVDSLPYFATLFFMLLFRWIAFDNNIFNLQDAHSGTGIMEALKNLIYFLALLVIPFDPRFFQVFLQNNAVLSYILLLISFTLFLFIIVRYRTRDILLFTLLLVLIISIIPASRLLMRWYMYLPSAVFCIILAYFVFSSSISHKIKLLISFLIFGFYFSLTLNKIIDWVDVSAKAYTSIKDLESRFENQVSSADELIFITVPAKVKDIPVFQLAFDKHLTHYLKQEKEIHVLSRSSLESFGAKIGFSRDRDLVILSQTGDNYFILSGVEKSIKFNNEDFLKGSLKRIKYNIEKEPNRIFFTFSNGEFHLIKDKDEI